MNSYMIAIILDFSCFMPLYEHVNYEICIMFVWKIDASMLVGNFILLIQMGELIYLLIWIMTESCCSFLSIFHYSMTLVARIDAYSCGF